MITTQQRAELTKKFGQNEKDTGSTAVQVAILTARINDLSGHFKSHDKDYHSKTGLMKMIGRRRRLLRYVQGKNPEGYAKLIKELGLRK